MKQWEQEKLKPIDKVFEPDFRNLLSCPDSNKAFEMHYNAISEISLSEDVDDDVRTQFEIARNLFLYSFFYYRFGMTSFKQAAACTELALRRYLGKPNNDRENGMKKLLRRAQSQGYINVKVLKPHLEPEQYIDILTNFRNDQAHGSHSLFMPQDCLSFIEDYSELLNQFFSNIRKKNIQASIDGWQ